MVPVSSKRLRRWASRIRKVLTSSSRASAEGTISPSIDLSDPLVNYYRHRARINLPNFYRFALQTRSIAIRDIFAQIAFDQHVSLDGLIEIINEFLDGDLAQENSSETATAFDSSVLLALADLMANTAREDLDTHAAVQIYEFVRRYFGAEALSPTSLLLNIEALHDLSEYENSQALAKAHNINEFAPLQTDLLHLKRLRMSSMSHEEWIAELNKLYARLNMSPVQLLEDSSLPLMDRLSAGLTTSLEGPMISIIVPTFSPDEGIRTALRSLVEQTWKNLEIIVVNDASPNEFDGLFKELEELDPRIRVLHQEENAGAYAARNAGLRVATGSFITTHDDDDWSHPDKIAMQVRPLIENESLVATTSGHMRTTENLNFTRVNAEARFLQMNYSSLMFRRSLIEQIGDWDPVNRGGDSEFYLRLLRYAGEDRVRGLHDKPLSFSRVWEGSLTSGEMSRGFFGYSRLIYRWAFRQWHRETYERDGRVYQSSDEARPYAVPTTFEPGQRNADLGDFDVVYVSDFFRQAKSVDNALAEMETLADNGFRVGYMHLYSPETRTTTAFPDRLFALQLAGKITQISLDDLAHTSLLIVYDTSIGMFLDQMRASLSSKRSIAIEQKQVSLADVEPRTPSYGPQALARMDACFNTRFESIGASEEEQNQLKMTVPTGRLLPDDMIWRTHVSESPGEIHIPTEVPVVGFHSNSNQYRLPNTREQFDNVYISDAFTTRFYGQVWQPLEKYGAEISHQVEFVEATDQSEVEFLSSIDFWVYWPHSRLVDRVWEPVLSALQAGKVVILPGSQEGLYGEAAVYAAEGDVKSLIHYYTQNHEAYVAQALRAQAFIAEEYTRDSFMSRVATLTE